MNIEARANGISPNTSARLRFTYAFYLALATVTAVTAARFPLAPLTSYAVDCVALLLVVTSCLGRIWCSAFIGGYKSAALITEGPYSIARHPLYSFSWVGALGLGLATHSIVLTAVTATFFSALLSGAARREDDFLAQAHPDRFSDYARTTPRFLPRWRHYNAPESLTVKPVILRKAFLDAGAFILLYLILDTLRLLRDSGLIPILCKIP